MTETGRPEGYVPGVSRTVIRGGRKCLGESEVQHLDDPIRRDLDVRGFQIAMDDPLLVCRFEGFGDLARDGERVIDRHAATRDPIREGVPLDELENERVGVAAVLKAVDRADVRMVERSEHLRLALEPRETIRILCERVREDLQRDLAVQLRIARAIHLAHAAGADGGEDFVRAEASAGLNGQLSGRWDYTVRFQTLTGLQEPAIGGAEVAKRWGSRTRD